MSRTRTSARRSRSAIEALEGRQLLASLLALTASNELRAFDDARPDLLGLAVAVTGLEAGENLVAIDSRAATGQVYGFGSLGRFYEVNTQSGAAKAVGGPLPIVLRGEDFDIEFTSATTLLMVTNVGQAQQFNLETGAVSSLPDFTYDPGDVAAGQAPDLRGAAIGGGGLYFIDARRGQAVSTGVTPGSLYTRFPLGITPAGDVGFDFNVSGGLYVSARTAGSTETGLYNLGGGAGPLVRSGTFPAGVAIRDIAVAFEVGGLARAVTSENRLVSFRTDAPGTILASVAITGVQPGETIQALSYNVFSPGGLYGFGSTGRLYRINEATGAASAVSATPISPAYDGTKASLTQFNGVGLFLLTTKGGQQLRINHNTGTAESAGPDLAYVADDSQGPGEASIVAEAFIPLRLQSGNNTFDYSGIFGIDSERDTIVRHLVTHEITGVARTNIPIGRDVTDDVALDSTLGSINSAVNYMILTEALPSGASGSALYRYDPSPLDSTTPAVLVRVGTIGGATIRDFAIAPTGRPVFTGTATGQIDLLPFTPISVSRLGGSAGTARFRYASTGGTAIPGIDYTPVDGFVTFADGETNKTFEVPNLRRPAGTGPRTVELAVYPDPSSGLAPSTTVLTITSPPADPTPPPVLTPGVAAASFVGSASSITSVAVAFNGPADAARAGSAANFRVTATTADRSARTITLSVAVAAYDPATVTTTIALAAPLNLRNVRSLRVTALGLAPGGTDGSIGSAVQRGFTTSYRDGDGDRVVLSAFGRGAQVVVVRRLDGGAASAYVNGRARLVTGFVIGRRGSNRRALINQFVTGGARLNLTRSITVGQVVALAAPGSAS